MASGQWSITNTSSAGGQATASKTHPSGASASETQLRLRALQASLAGTSAGAGQLVVRDGASGSGTVLLAMELSVVVNGGQAVTPNSIDVRASVGNNLTIEFTSGVAGDIETVNAQGDLVPTGYPFGAP